MGSPFGIETDGTGLHIEAVMASVDVETTGAAIRPWREERDYLDVQDVLTTYRHAISAVPRADRMIRTSTSRSVSVRETTWESWSCNHCATYFSDFMLKSARILEEILHPMRTFFALCLLAAGPLRAADRWVEQGNEAFYNLDYDESIAAYEKALAASPELHSTIISRMRCFIASYFAMGRSKANW